MTMLAVFRSRAQSLEFISVLKSGGVAAQAVNTPREANVGCGISVKFEEPFFPRVQYYLRRKPYTSFSGFMKKSFGGRFMYI